MHTEGLVAAISATTAWPAARRLIYLKRKSRHPLRMSQKCQEPTHAPQQNRAYSITSSAIESMSGDTSRPIARAVLRLMTNSYLVGSSTGRSPGLAPRKMRST